MKINPKINNFIQDILLIDKEKGEMVISLRELVLKIVPEIKEEIKYGGLVFVDNKRLFCGIFIRKNHISVEFDRGAECQDSDNFLEGSGKLRRHLKIFSIIKEVFLRQKCLCNHLKNIIIREQIYFDEVLPPIRKSDGVITVFEC